MPFAAATHDGVLTLTLDTPGSPINIFNHATAHQLIEILSAVTPSTTRAIVFETAKPHSFINGVGLLLAHASQTEDDLVRASTPPWTAYRAVREAPVPTIAVVQGNCFGCGVEFALSCDYRIASDTCETRFYMTELNDYLFLPLFGCTWTLPEAVGLADSVDLLLWGARWSAEHAAARGLIDGVAPHNALAEHRQQFVERVIDGTRESRRRGRVTWSAGEEAVMERTRQRIGALPPPYQTLYSEALDLLAAGARQMHGYVGHHDREFARSAASALAPIGKAAYAFFYVRQMAAERAAGRARGDVPRARFAADVRRGDDARAFADDLCARKLAGDDSANPDAADFRLVAPADGGCSTPAHRAASNGRGVDVAVRVALADGPSADVELYAPTYPAGGRLVELAVRGEAALSPDTTVRLGRTLLRFGFEVARTTPANTFVTTRLLVAYLIPLVRFIERGGEAGVVDATLRAAGFVRRPRHLFASLHRIRLAEQLAGALATTLAAVEPGLADILAPAAPNGDPPPRCAQRTLPPPSERETVGCAVRTIAPRPDDVLMHAVCLSLLEASLTARAEGEVRDPSIVDLIARELLDFPRHLTSLCTWLKKARVAGAAQDARARSLVTDAALEAARRFVADGREFYR
jgi:enoyl-CoA hydratase/carnithine racemase